MGRKEKKARQKLQEQIHSVITAAALCWCQVKKNQTVKQQEKEVLALLGRIGRKPNVGEISRGKFFGENSSGVLSFSSLLCPYFVSLGALVTVDLANGHRISQQNRYS